MKSRLDEYLPKKKLELKSAVERLKTPETNIVGRLDEVQENINLRLHGVLDIVRRAADTYPCLRTIFKAVCDNQVDMHKVVQEIRHDAVAEELVAVLDQALADSIYSSVKQAELKLLLDEQQRLIDKSLEQETQS